METGSTWDHGHEVLVAGVARKFIMGVGDLLEAGGGLDLIGEEPRLPLGSF